MNITNIYQAKTQLSALVESALAGNEVIIARAGKPLVRLVPYTEPMQERVPGLFTGKIIVPDDFDDVSNEIIELFTQS